MNIALIGFRGTGKTIISQLLARSLDKKLVSIDEEIAKKAKMSVPKFIKKHGWDKFRSLESEVVENISELDDCVFDTSGGIVMRNENIINLKRSALIILLTADLKTIMQRVKSSNKKVASMKSDYLEELKEVMDEREPRYRKAADYTVDTSGVSPEQVCDMILHYVKSEME